VPNTSGLSNSPSASAAGDTTPPVWECTEDIQEAYQVGPGTVRVRWNRATDQQIPPVRYDVYYEIVVPSTPQNVIERIEGNSSRSWSDYYFDVPGLEADKLHSFNVRAVDNAGNETPYSLGLLVTVRRFKTISEINRVLS